MRERVALRVRFVRWYRVARANLYGRRRPAREVLCGVFALCTKQDEFTHGHAPTERDKRPDNNTRDEYGLQGFAAQHR